MDLNMASSSNTMTLDERIGAIQAYRSRRHSTFGTFHSTSTAESEDDFELAASPASSYQIDGSPPSKSSSRWIEKSRETPSSLQGLMISEISTKSDETFEDTLFTTLRPLSFHEQRFSPTTSPMRSMAPSRNLSRTSLLNMQDDDQPNLVSAINTPGSTGSPVSGARPPLNFAQSRQNSIPALSTFADGTTSPTLKYSERPKAKRFSSWMSRVGLKAPPGVAIAPPEPASYSRPAFAKHNTSPNFWLYSGDDSDTIAEGAVHDQDLFDTLLPHELRLRIFRTLVKVVSAEAPLTNERWCGRAKGLRELFKIMRVSKTWLHLTMDGQLWHSFDAAWFGPSSVQASSIMRMASVAGPFLRNLTLRGMRSLQSKDLDSITNACTLSVHTYRQTRLTALDLSGCFGIDADALDRILALSPVLKSVNLRGLFIVDVSHLQTLFHTSVCLQELNVGRCRSLHASALAEIPPMVGGKMRSIRMSNLPAMSDDYLYAVVAACPVLSTIDFSDSQEITDKVFQRISSLYRANVRTLMWRHLKLPGCPLLSDAALGSLAGIAPKLEILEAAELGPDLRDAGLIELFQTTPLLQRVDLEGAAEITDRTISSLTPPLGRFAGWTGQHLQHLTISYAGQVTDAALVRLIAQCPMLHTLEADNTRITDAVPNAFIQTMSEKGAKGAELAIVDCGGLGRQLPIQHSTTTRFRRAQIGWQWAHLRYSSHGLTDEFDSTKIVLHSYNTWAALDAAARGVPNQSQNRNSNNQSYRSAAVQEPNPNCTIS